VQLRVTDDLIVNQDRLCAFQHSVPISDAHGTEAKVLGSADVVRAEDAAQEGG